MKQHTTPKQAAQHLAPNTFQLDPRFRFLLSNLWAGGAWAYWWTPRVDFTDGMGQSYSRTISRWFRVEEPAAIPTAWLQRCNVFFGVLSTAAIPTTDENGQRRSPERLRARNELIASMGGLALDFDAKSWQHGKPAILEHLDTMWRAGWPWPTCIIDSGGGFHCYWLLCDPLRLCSENDRSRAGALLAAWADAWGADSSVKDLARVLRVPGTLNRKPEYAPNFPTVTIVDFHRGRFLDNAELIELVGEAAEARIAARQPQPNQTQEGRRAAIASDQDRISAMLEHDPVAQALWAGDMAAFDNDHSRADIALCQRLRFYADGDRALIDRLFRASALYRPKWERQDYRERTIGAAMRNWDGEYWQPPDPARAEALEAARAAVGSNMTQLDRAAAIQAMRAAVQQGVQQ